MSTRATIHFLYKGKKDPIAIIYRHSDGYPEGLGEDLKEFFKDVEEQTKDGINGTRFNDPSYLAAKWVVWDADQHAREFNSSGEYEKSEMLNFLSVGIVNEDPSDIEFRYLVKCNTGHDSQEPEVICQEV